jgi:hypothetical protein
LYNSKLGVEMGWVRSRNMGRIAWRLRRGFIDGLADRLAGRLDDGVSTTLSTSLDPLLSV